MASSSSFNMNRSSGYESTSQINPSFEFNSTGNPKLGGPRNASSSGHSRQRFVRTRKSASSRSMGSSEIQKINLGINPSRSNSDNLTGISCRLSSPEDDECVNKNGGFNLKVTNKVDKVGSALIDEIRKLRVESQNPNHLNKGLSASFSATQQLGKGIDSSYLSKIPELTPAYDGFHANHEASLGLSECGNVDRSKKDIGDGGQDFVFGATTTSGFVFGSDRKNDSGIASTLPQSIENLNIDDSDKINRTQKQVNGNKGSQTSEMDKEIVVSEVSIDHVHLDSSCSSSLRKEPCQNSGNEDVIKFNNSEFAPKKEGFSFSEKHDSSKTLHIEFKTPAPKGNLPTGSKKPKSGAKKGAVKGTLSKARKGKAQELITVLTNSLPNDPELSKSCSRMDDKQIAGECSLTFDNQMENNEGNHVSRCFVNTNVANGENNVDSNADVQNCHQTQHNILSSSSVSSGGTSFTFAASSSAQGQANATMRQIKKKNRMKSGRDIYIPPRTTVLYDTSSSLPSSPIPRLSVLPTEVGQKDGVPSALQKGGISLKITSPTSKMVGDVIPKDGKTETTTSPTSLARGASEACEKWRLRGNQAYANGNLDKAEEYYTQGLSCIPQNETSRDCLRAMVLCYSNRAATRMSRGRMREALGDCLVAAEIDPNFFRVQLRAANCYLALGEGGDASRYFKKLLQSTAICVERKLILEASDGLQKAQKVSECIDRSSELLLQRTLIETENALSIIAEALVISPYSEQLLESKAEALFTLRRYEEVIHLCEQSLEAAEKNSTPLSEDGQSSDLDSSEIYKIYSFRIWRYCLIIKSNFCLGRLEDALDFLEKQEQWRSMQDKYGKETVESLIPQLTTIRELIRHKCAGTEAFQAGRHAEAVEHYTAALASNVESHPFAAVCFTSRAAAYQALGQIADAIADCSLAIALDGSYMKAISARAALFEMIRAYDKAAKDLQRIVSILNKQAEEKGNLLGASSPTGLVAELRQARHRFYQMQEQASKDVPLNCYLILGVEPCVTAADLRKAYRKAALRHHPDKAGQSLARSESGEDRLQKEIALKVYEDTDKLFKMIAHAYAVLSDPIKCSQYDIEEQKRNRQRRSGGSDSTSIMHTSERNCSSARQWQEARRLSSNNSNARAFDQPTRSSRYYS